MNKIRISYNDRPMHNNEFFDIVNEDIKKNSAILDAGCGDGFCSIVSKNINRKNTPGLRIIGIDIFKKNLDKNRYVDINIRGNLESLSKILDKKVSVIYSEYVFEHLKDPIKVITEMHKCLEPGGKIFLLMPNGSNLLLFLNSMAPNWARLFYLQKILKQQRTKNQVFPAHYKFDAEAIKKISPLFKKIDIHYYNGMGCYFGFSRLLQRLSDLYENIFKNHKIIIIIILEK